VKKPTRAQLRRLVCLVSEQVAALEREQTAAAASTLRKTSQALATKRRTLTLTITDARKAGAL